MGIARQEDAADEVQRRNAGNGGKGNPNVLSFRIVLLQSGCERGDIERITCNASPNPGRSLLQERIPIPVAISRSPYACSSCSLPCMPRPRVSARGASTSASRVRSKTIPIHAPSNARFQRRAYLSSGCSTCLPVSRPEYDLHAAVFLVSEGLVHARAVLKAHAVGYNERRVDLSFLDPT